MDPNHGLEQNILNFCWHFQIHVIAIIIIIMVHGANIYGGLNFEVVQCYQTEHSNNISNSLEIPSATADMTRSYNGIIRR
jgi:hypothetical protein